jgi:hypothetical protein
MTILYANNAAGTLASGITNASTTLTLLSPPTAFPAPVPPQVFYVTLTDAATQTLIEIVKVTAVAGNVFSIVRAQDGTSALSWLAGDIVSERTIALELRGFENAAEGLFSAQNVTITPSTTLGIAGTTLADNANAGSVGEFFSVQNTVNPLLSAVPTSGVSVSLTAGDWDVQGTAQFLGQGGAAYVALLVGVSTTVGFGPIGTVTSLPFTANTGVDVDIPAPAVRVNVAVTTTVRLIVQANFITGGSAVIATIRARRVR